MDLTAAVASPWLIPPVTVDPPAHFSYGTFAETAKHP
jgi:hypothetical protein